MLVYFFLPLLASLIFYHLYTKYYQHLPKLKFWRVELFPSVRIIIRGRIIHLHHWFGFLIILSVTFFVESGFLANLGFKGFLSGGIIQGLFTRSARKIIIKLNR